MKKIGLKIVWVLMFGLFMSCASAPTESKPYRPLSGFPNASVIGSIDTSFEGRGIMGDFGVTSSARSRGNNAAYYALLDAARQRYGQDIDIVDIYYVYSHSRTTEAAYATYVFRAFGKVIRKNGT